MSMKCLSWCLGGGVAGASARTLLAPARTPQHGLAALPQAGGMDAALDRTRSRMRSVSVGAGKPTRDGSVR